uniref:Small ribosomal subunit protein uS4c n=1 Tax=Microglena monadina TaxID=47904 RepID=A0A0S2IB59_9CHLO|nr:ribosomal protein S4 [Microglena monadina]
MSKYIGPKLRITRRLGQLRGLTRKKPHRRVIKFFKNNEIITRVIPPGQHGRAKLAKRTGRFNTSKSNYLIRLKVKQKLRFNYGLTERQLVLYVKKAKKIKESTGQVLLQLLEMRLDNIIFRLNMAPTIMAARQIINHGHIYVNNKKVNIPSYMCQPKDVISVAIKQKSLKLVNKNLSRYYKRIQSFKKRFSNNIAFLLTQVKAVLTISLAMQLIREGKVFEKDKFRNKIISRVNSICPPGSVIYVRTKKGVVRIRVKKPINRRKRQFKTNLKKKMLDL